MIKRNEFEANVDGIDLQAASRGNTIRQNDFRHNLSRGVMIRGDSTDHVIKENTFTGNRVGILVFAGVDNIVEDNVVSASTLAGIRINVFATGNLIMRNRVTSNPAGIEFLVSGTQSAVGNTVAKNTLQLNTCALKGPLTGNSVEKNLLEGNVADVCF